MVGRPQAPFRFPASLNLKGITVPRIEVRRAQVLVEPDHEARGSVAEHDHGALRQLDPPEVLEPEDLFVPPRTRLDIGHRQVKVANTKKVMGFSHLTILSLAPSMVSTGPATARGTPSVDARQALGITGA